MKPKGLLLMAVAAGVLAGSFMWLRFSVRTPHERTTASRGRSSVSDKIPPGTDALNTTYRINGALISLHEGEATRQASPECAASRQVSAWKAPVMGRVNADEREDAVVLLVGDLGGSGTLYYVAAALAMPGGYCGTNGILLGDGIVPGAVTVRDGVIVQDYLDRGGDEPFAGYPRIEKTAYIKFQQEELQLMRVEVRGKQDLIHLNREAVYPTISSPAVITGRARGVWFFEGDFPIRLHDEAEHLLGQAVARAQDEWMTEHYVPFRAELVFTPPLSGEGVLVLEKDNPSDRRELDDALRVPVYFR